MTNQRSDRSNQNSQENRPKKGPMYHKQNQEGWDQRNRYGTGRMETFPQPRTFPKRWDLSGISNDTK